MSESLKRMAYLKSIETSKAVILIVSLMASGITIYEIGNRLSREGIPFSSLLIDALESFGVLFDSNTMNEMMRRYEDGSWKHYH